MAFNYRAVDNLKRSHENMVRYRQILSVLIKYGFGDVFSRIRSERFFEGLLRAASKETRYRIKELSKENRLRKVLEELGPTFVKVGQVLSTRPDLVGTDLAREFEKLQDNVSPIPFNDIRGVVEEDLGAPLDEIFKSFDTIPLAAASIGQVHRAQLTNGQDVVVKVQRPGIPEIIRSDIHIIRHLASIAEKHIEEWEIQQPTRIVDEFARMIEKELDYKLEIAHAERFAHQFADDKTIRVPGVFPELSSQHIITMEYVRGIKASEISLLHQSGLDCALLARRGADLIMKQIFVHGFIHADPHPGNILFMENNIVCYLDFGMMSRVNRKQAESLVDAATYAIKHDEVRLTDIILKIVNADHTPNRSELENDISELLDRYLFRELEYLNMSEILSNTMTLIAKHHLRIPPDYYIMVKALATSQALGRKLDPRFNYTEALKPFISRIRLAKFLPDRIISELFNLTGESINLLKEIPKDTGTILNRFARGDAEVQLQHRGLETMLSTLDRTSNRLSFAIIVASLVIGSSVVVLSGVPPKLYGLPVIGIIGYVIAAFMALYLAFTILRHGKL